MGKAGSPNACCNRNHLRCNCCNYAKRLEAFGCLFIGCPPWIHCSRYFRTHQPGNYWWRHANGEPRNFYWRIVPYGGNDLRASPHTSNCRIEGHSGCCSNLCRLLHVDHVVVNWASRPERFRGRIPHSDWFVPNRTLVGSCCNDRSYSCCAVLTVGIPTCVPW